LYRDSFFCAAPATVVTLGGISAGHTDGALSSATFNLPAGIAVDTAGVIYVSDSGSGYIRMISTSSTYFLCERQ
jgi:DNA-binding beta-propeller fold protein YncE